MNNIIKLSLFALLTLCMIGCGNGSDQSSILGTVFPATPSTSTNNNAIALLAPSNVVATSSGTTITISWDAVANATSYNIYYGNSTGVNKSSSKLGSVTTLSYQHTGLTAQNYYYIVTAVNTAGEGAISAEVSSTVINAVPSSAPIGVSAVNSGTANTISWDALPGATSYNIYFSNSSGVTTSSTKLTNVSTTSYQHTGLTAQNYYYIVTAVNSTGEGAASGQVSCTVPVSLPSGAPTNVSATNSTTTITLSWTAVPTATSYNIYWGNNPGVTISNGTKISNGSATSYQHTGLTAKNYYYIVTAANAAGEGAASTQVSSLVVYSPPTGLVATPSGTLMNLTWSPVPNATSYNVYYGATGFLDKNSTKITNISNTSYQQPDIIIGNTYYYAVTALFGTNESSLSSVVAGQNTNFIREMELNDTTVAANSITIGDTVRGQLSSSTDVDYYTFTSKGGVVSFSILPDVTFASSGYVKATILGSDGKTIFSSIDGISGSNTLPAILNAQLPTGYYYLKFELGNAGNSKAFNNDYIVYSSYNFTQIREVEPNNTLSTATPITLGGGTIRGQLSNSADIDYYKFTATGGTVSFSILPDASAAGSISSGNMKASIIDFDGVIYTSIDNISGTGTIATPLISNLKAGSYYLKLELGNAGNSKAFNNDYILTY